MKKTYIILALFLFLGLSQGSQSQVVPKITTYDYMIGSGANTWITKINNAIDSLNKVIDSLQVHRAMIYVAAGGSVDTSRIPMQGRLVNDSLYTFGTPTSKGGMHVYGGIRAQGSFTQGNKPTFNFWTGHEFSMWDFNTQTFGMYGNSDAVNKYGGLQFYHSFGEAYIRVSSGSVPDSTKMLRLQVTGLTSFTGLKTILGIANNSATFYKPLGVGISQPMSDLHVNKGIRGDSVIAVSVLSAPTGSVAKIDSIVIGSAVVRDSLDWIQGDTLRWRYTYIEQPSGRTSTGYKTGVVEIDIAQWSNATGSQEFFLITDSTQAVRMVFTEVLYHSQRAIYNYAEASERKYLIAPTETASIAVLAVNGSGNTTVVAHLTSVSTASGLYQYRLRLQESQAANRQKARLRIEFEMPVANTSTWFVKLTDTN